MGKLHKNFDGFGTVETILIVVIVIAVGLVGWYVYKSLKNTNNTYNAATSINTSNSPKFVKLTKKSSSLTTSNTSSTATIKIAALGIQFSAPSSINDLTFTTPSTSGNEVRVGISTASIANLDAACSATAPNVTGLTGSALGTIIKGTGTSPYPAPGDPNVLIKQLPSIYVAYEPPQMGYCSTDGSVDNTIQADINTLKTALASVQQLY